MQSSNACVSPRQQGTAIVTQTGDDSRALGESPRVYVDVAVDLVPQRNREHEMSFRGRYVDLVREAIVWIMRNVGRYDNFKIGRSNPHDADKLLSREMYDGADDVLRCRLSGRRGIARRAAIALEKDLIDWSWQYFPEQCMNERFGGGPSTKDAEQVVYIVLWRRARRAA
jgi:hypothetical protein